MKQQEHGENSLMGCFTVVPLTRYLGDHIEGDVFRHVACMGEKKNVLGKKT